MINPLFFAFWFWSLMVEAALSDFDSLTVTTKPKLVAVQGGRK